MPPPPPPAKRARRAPLAQIQPQATAAGAAGMALDPDARPRRGSARARDQAGARDLLMLAQGAAAGLAGQHVRMPTATVAAAAAAATAAVPADDDGESRRQQVLGSFLADHTEGARPVSRNLTNVAAAAVAAADVFYDASEEDQDEGRDQAAAAAAPLPPAARGTSERTCREHAAKITAQLLRLPGGEAQQAEVLCGVLRRLDKGVGLQVAQQQPIARAQAGFVTNAVENLLLQAPGPGNQHKAQAVAYNTLLTGLVAGAASEGIPATVMAEALGGAASVQRIRAVQKQRAQAVGEHQQRVEAAAAAPAPATAAELRYQREHLSLVIGSPPARAAGKSAVSEEEVLELEQIWESFGKDSPRPKDRHK